MDFRVDFHIVKADLPTGDLDLVARAFSAFEVDPKARTQTCFRRIFWALEKGEWHRIDSLHRPISLLVDQIGRSLLFVAVNQQKDAIVKGLVEREIGITTVDKLDKHILHYLSFCIAGSRSADYSDWIHRKLNSIYTRHSLDKLYRQEEKLSLEYSLDGIFLDHIRNNRFDHQLAISTLEKKINQYAAEFQHLHLGSLKYIKNLENAQRKANLVLEANLTKNYRERLRTIILGYIPFFMEEFISEQEVLGLAASGYDADIDYILKKLKNKVTSCSAKEFHYLPQVAETLYQVAVLCMQKSRFEKVAEILGILFQLPESTQKKKAELFVDIYGAVAFYFPFFKGMIDQSTFEAYMTKAIELSSLLPIEKRTDLHQYHYERGMIYRDLGRLNDAEVDFRNAISLTVGRGDIPIRFTCLSSLQAAMILKELNQYENALANVNKADDLFERDGNKSESDEADLFSSILELRINLLDKLEKYDEAEKCALEQVEFACELKDEFNHLKASAYLTLGRLHLKIDRVADSIENLQYAYSYSAESLELSRAIALALGDAYEREGNHEQAKSWRE